MKGSLGESPFGVVVHFVCDPSDLIHTLDNVPVLLFWEYEGMGKLFGVGCDGEEFELLGEGDLLGFVERTGFELLDVDVFGEGS